jgi:hypothetical protein
MSVSMEWITQVKERGWDTTLLSMLDVIEPFAPLVGQAMLLGEPMAMLMGQRQAWHDLSQLLDEPQGVEQLRQLLRE